MKYKVFSFYPVKVYDGSEEFKSIEESWQWKYFGWAFCLFNIVNSICYSILGEEAQFPIKTYKE